MEAGHAGGFRISHGGAVEGRRGRATGLTHAAENGEGTGTGREQQDCREHGERGPQPVHAVRSGVMGDHEGSEAKEAGATNSFQQRFDGGGDAHAIGRDQFANAGEIWRITDAGIDLDEHPDDQQADVVQWHG